MNLTFRRERETIQSILDEARAQEWHAGNKYAFYQHYRYKVIRLAKDNTERDQTLESLRLIFGLMRLP